MYSTEKEVEKSVVVLYERHSVLLTIFVDKSHISSTAHT